jgi:hypothetical protein
MRVWISPKAPQFLRDLLTELADDWEKRAADVGETIW